MPTKTFRPKLTFLKVRVSRIFASCMYSFPCLQTIVDGIWRLDCAYVTIDHSYRAAYIPLNLLLEASVSGVFSQPIIQPSEHITCHDLLLHYSITCQDY